MRRRLEDTPLAAYRTSKPMALHVQAKLKEMAAATKDREALLQQEASQWQADYAELEKRHRSAEEVAAHRRADADELKRHADMLRQEVRLGRVAPSGFCSQGDPSIMARPLYLLHCLCLPEYYKPLPSLNIVKAT